MKFITKIRWLLIGVFGAIFLLLVLPLAWLWWESSLPRDEWFDERQGQIESVSIEESLTRFGQRSESVTLISDTGLRVSFRVIRNIDYDAPMPVLLVLGGHRTGSDAVEFFGDVGDLAMVGVDYPYDGPERVRGFTATAKMIPQARRAFLDTTPAISLIIDWLLEQGWVDKNKIVVVGASLGVPFAAISAARDRRITAVMLVHGAADNREWLEVQLARRIEPEFLHYPLSAIVHRLAYGPVLDTPKHIATVSPRPVLIIGARNDERTTAGQTELLFDAVGEPRRLRWTEGQHIQPNRPEIIDELLRIADEEMPFLTQQ